MMEELRNVENEHLKQMSEEVMAEREVFYKLMHGLDRLDFTLLGAMLLTPGEQFAVSKYVIVALWLELPGMKRLIMKWEQRGTWSVDLPMTPISSWRLRVS